jgi:hypothetical protein
MKSVWLRLRQRYLLLPALQKPKWRASTAAGTVSAAVGSGGSAHLFVSATMDA